ncbi:endoglucanase [Acetobacter okinawensis]|uniref:glycosyl hydrolase family 8 n=1 Tax=Acetobacter okinawensis TaxID=1076594 RepID=UPI001BABA45F|nr:glycosyl hydrolase family 8 [Acetobacter okinawensis]MBS0966265.1 endoglucanase [Acetobacter okinawensis]
MRGIATMYGKQASDHSQGMSLSRRTLLWSAAALPLCAQKGMAQAVDDWTWYASHFLRDDGRIIDNGNGSQSHTEGQGYGMLFAQASDDKQAFEKIFSWTENNLKLPDSALHAWHYLPDTSPHVPDSNNATDGDLLIALALAFAGYRWQKSEYLKAARAIYKDVRKKLVLKIAGKRVLLPGCVGFSTPDAVTVNLSYYVMPSLILATGLDNAEVWRGLIKDGLTLIRNGRFGRWKLPPDWLQMSSHTGELSIAPQFPPRFSYDAVRVPLYLAWAGQLGGDLMAGFENYWTAWPTGGLPAWVDLKTGERSAYNAPPGFYDIGGACGFGNMAGVMPPVQSNENYYSSSLAMLSGLVKRQFGADIMAAQYGRGKW